MLLTSGVCFRQVKATSMKRRSASERLVRAFALDGGAGPASAPEAEVASTADMMNDQMNDQTWGGLVEELLLSKWEKASRRDLSCGKESCFPGSRDRLMF